MLAAFHQTLDQFVVPFVVANPSIAHPSAEYAWLQPCIHNVLGFGGTEPVFLDQLSLEHLSSTTKVNVPVGVYERLEPHHPAFFWNPIVFVVPENFT